MTRAHASRNGSNALSFASQRFAGLAAGAASAALSRAAFGQDAGLGQMEMGERYDSVARSIEPTKSAAPTFSAFTAQATQNAVGQYARSRPRGAGSRFPAKAG